jgi:lysophospholipase L1-like esterase
MKHYLATITLLFTLVFTTSLQAQHENQLGAVNLNKESTWKGFKQINFTLEGRNAHVLLPLKALAGNPWVWRARFPNYHANIDSTLLAKGFHVAYVNTDHLFGSPKAMKIWDEFYAYLIENYQLEKKVAMHCHSRGGLFAYNWAKQNPEKIACIYADAVVCDFKSWPAGFGTSEGSEKAWQRLKIEYGFSSDKEAKAYLNNPIDNLEKLAKAGVPILHTVNLKDQVVPPEENSLLLVDRYIRLGGRAMVSPFSLEIQKSKGHHYELADPKMIVDFISYYSIQDGPLNSSDYHEMRSGLQNCRIQFERYKKGRVAFLGGSITFNPGWRDSICGYLEKRFPETEFEFIAAGIPSMGTTPGAFRLERDVLSKGKIDLLFEEAAVNDAGNGRTASEQVRAMEGIVRHVRSANASTDIVMMHFVDPGKIESYRAGKVPDVIQNHDRVAEHYNIPVINLANEVTDRIDNGEFTWKDDFENLHPSPFGQGVYAHSMLQFLDNAFAGHIDNDDKITAHSKPDYLDPFCYEKGALRDISICKLAKGWTVDSLWNPHDGKRTRRNYVNVPMLISNTVGSKLKLTLQGKTLGIAVAAGPDAGIIEYRIDKGDWQKLNLFTRWSKGLHLPWYYILASDLENKKHNLEIRISEEKDEQSVGTACRIRYFLVNQ